MIRLAIRCRADHAERVLAELVELCPNGVEEADSDPAADVGDEAAGGGWVEYAVYGPPGEMPAIPELEAAAGAGLVEVSSTEVPDDWADSWQDFHKPVLVGDRLWVRPSWEPPREGAIDLIVDPGQAFGTGAHATTRMCLELLVELADAGHAHGPLSDLGTGSGVLAIAAARLGFGPVTGYDHEPAALDASSANATANGVRLALERVNLRERVPALDATVVANLTAPLLLGVAQGLEGPPPDRMVCSGMLVAEADQVARELARRGLVEHTRRRSGDWVALGLEAAV